MRPEQPANVKISNPSAADHESSEFICPARCMRPGKYAIHAILEQLGKREFIIHVSANAWSRKNFSGSRIHTPTSHKNGAYPNIPQIARRRSQRILRQNDKISRVSLLDPP